MRTPTLAAGVVVVAALAATYAPAADEAPAWAYNRDDRTVKDRADHLSRLGVRGWHAAGIRGEGVTIAVLDSGFRGFKDHIGKSLPAGLIARSARVDGNMEYKDSEHGILCGEVASAIAPGAKMLIANWDADRPESFLDAVRWAKAQGATIVTCSVVKPSWSDGEGGGPVHKKLAEILGDGSHPGDVLFFSCAGNTARRHWAGNFDAGPDGYHRWSDKGPLNGVSPWGEERVYLEMCWPDAEAKYAVEVIDPDTGRPAPDVTYKERTEPASVSARFTPVYGQKYSLRVKQTAGRPGKFHMNSLYAYIDECRLAGSIPFPGDGPEVVTVGAINHDGARASFSACGPNSSRPKPDVVAPVPFGTYIRYWPFSGTSCATPQAAAVGALCCSRHPNWTATQVRHYITSRALDLGPTGHDCETGYGAVRLPELAPAPRLIMR
ncbi:MAG TPA: S8 family serine peptidase [Urbifossiella sp.]|jgi:subtilisin family serine protease|nr:S8 family serine peptidase [Urbifossiella sp.]